MVQQNQTRVPVGILKVCSIAGILGAALELVPSLQLKDMPKEVSAFLGGVGTIAFYISFVVILLFTIKKIKQTSEKKPSPVVIYILIATLLLSVIAEICAWGEPDSINMFSLVSAILLLVMLIVTGILFLLKTATKKIGIWMVGIVVGSLVASLMAGNLGSVNKLTIFIPMIIYACPVAMMFGAFNNYLSGDESLELTAK